MRELAKLNPPRKYYQNYQRTRGANDDMLHAPQGLHAFFRAYYHYKSADWKGNKPHPLKARTAEEMAQIPTYYVMEKDKGMAETVAPFMPSAAEIAACKWLTEAEVEVYATEYGRTGFTGALQGYRVRRGSDPKSIAEMLTFSGRTIDVPSHVHRGQERLGRLSDARRGRQMQNDRLHAHGRISSARRRRPLGAAGAAGSSEHPDDWISPSVCWRLKMKERWEDVPVVAGNGLLHRRAFLRGGAAFAGALVGSRSFNPQPHNSCLMIHGALRRAPASPQITARDPGSKKCRAHAQQS